MENVDQMTYSAVTLVYLAQDVVEAAKKGRKEAAKMSWYELVGAATMYGVFTDDDPHPIERYAVPKVRAACKFVGIEEEAVWKCIFDY